MCTKNAQKFELKTRSKILSYSVVKSPILKDAFTEFIELEASPVEGQSPQQKDTKRREGPPRLA